MYLPMVSLMKLSVIKESVWSMMSEYISEHILLRYCTNEKRGAGCSSVDSVPASEAVGRRIDPSQWTQLSLGYFPFQPVVHNWFIKGHGMYCSVYGKVHIKDPLLLIEKSSLCGGSGFPSKKCVNMTIWMTSNNQW